MKAGQLTVKIVLGVYDAVNHDSFDFVLKSTFSEGHKRSA
jgi:hypothetical protein